MSIANIPGTSKQERLAVTNHALHSISAIDDRSREKLEHDKQEVAKEFEIAMGTCGKTYKELYARRNRIARSLWMAKTKSCIEKKFLMDIE